MDLSESMTVICLYLTVMTSDLAHALQFSSSQHSVLDFQSWILEDVEQRIPANREAASLTAKWQRGGPIGVTNSRSGHARTKGQRRKYPEMMSHNSDLDLSISERASPEVGSSDTVRIRDKKIGGNSRRLLAHPLTPIKDNATAFLEAIENTQRARECDSNPGPSLKQLPYALPPTMPFTSRTASAVATANELNNRFLVWDAEPTLYEDQYYYDKVTSILDADTEKYLYGAGIAFEKGQYGGTSISSFGPYRFRDKALISNDDDTRYSTTGNDSILYEWFQKQRNKSFSELLSPKRDTCPSSGDDAVVVTERHGSWHGPFFKCPGAVWYITFSVPFFGCDKENVMRFKGVVKLDFDLRHYDINQCDTDTESNPFANSHRCKETTKCTFTPGRGFQRGSYRCDCLPGHYINHTATDQHQPNQATPYFNGTLVESSYQEKLRDNKPHYDRNFICLPCQPSCGNCSRGTTCPPCSMSATCSNCSFSHCMVENDNMIRGIPLGLQSLCMCVCLVIGAVIIRLRRTKVMKASMWVLLELIIFGALLLYATVVIQFFEPSNVRCIILPWFREVGFAIVYGALILKVYKVLAEFQSRKAHRVLVRDKDLLKYMACIILIVVGYMAAWTAVSMDHVSEGNSMLEQGLTNQSQTFLSCKDRYWDYIVEFGELLFLLVGIYLCYCTRQAPSDYLERRYITWVIYNETFLSAVFHVTRHFIWLHFHPDYMYLLYFVRCQVTVTIALLLIIGPKIWYAHRPPEDDHFRNRAYSSSDVQDNVLPESMKLHVAVSSNGDVDLGEVNLSEMDPEDIRSELKRLYTQLQIYRTKTMRKDNPHISKRRGGRKATHRRFSLQAFHHKHRHHHHSETGDHDHEMSRTPEESTNSAEGVAVSMCEESSIGEVRTPTVTFKPGHKSIY